MEITFKFKLDENVTTPFGEHGIIDMLGYDEGGVKYYVKSNNPSNWFKEWQLISPVISPVKIDFEKFR